ncbi:MAG: DNA primase [Candidatus Magasanikbacteria bacterium]|nr:DNA primase [Candidatus Magasanikbacteria bacterium]|tara:strand:+ start:4699 stop:6486 length:1788 start_codon:yes stop_codon:yes gene_type:complete
MSDTQRIKDAIDIVDFIGEYIQLKSAGSSHKGLCPFHNESTPSFMVSKDRQAWYCFGCAKGGDIFTFLQDIEGMEFVEALKHLASRAGIEIEFKQSKINANKKNRLRDIHKEAARFFHNVLLKMDVSKEAREYLHKRGLTENTIETWQIGYIPEQWDLLTKYLLKKGHSIDDLIASGLTIKKDGANSSSGRGFYDRFRGRILFPICDAHGHVSGFTGRLLKEGDGKGGKYINTPQTELFDKSRLIFGLHVAKQAIKKNNLAVIVEGQTDVISSHQAGLTHVVASSGTALTEEQVVLLKRYTKNIAMAFDADEAGQKAAKRGIDIAIEHGLNVRVIRIPEGAGKDPDECIAKDKNVWIQAVDQAQDVMNWYVDKAFFGKDITNPKDKQYIANELIPEIRRIPFAIERDHWLKEVSFRLGIESAVLREEMTLSKEKKQGNAQQQKPEEKIQKLPVKLTRKDAFIEKILGLILTFPVLSSIDNIFQDKYFKDSTYWPLYGIIKQWYTNNTLFTVQSLCEGTEDHNSVKLVQILLLKCDEEFSGISEEKARKELDSFMKLLIFEWKKEYRNILQKKIEHAEKQNNQDLLQELLKEFQEI